MTKIDLDLDKIEKSKECEIYHYNCFNNGFKYDLKICNRCNWRIESFGSFATITSNGVGYRFFMFDMTEKYVIEFIKNFEPNEFWQCCNMKKLILQKKLTLVKQLHQKNVCFVIIGILKMLVLNLNLMFAIRCHDILATAYELKNITKLNVIVVDYSCILCGISRNEAVNILISSVLEYKCVL